MALLTSGNHVTHTSSGTGVGDPGGWREQEPALKTETEKGMTLMETQTESRPGFRKTNRIQRAIEAH